MKTPEELTAEIARRSKDELIHQMVYLVELFDQDEPPSGPFVLYCPCSRTPGKHASSCSNYNFHWHGPVDYLGGTVKVNVQRVNGRYEKIDPSQPAWIAAWVPFQ